MQSVCLSQSLVPDLTFLDMKFLQKYKPTERNQERSTTTRKKTKALLEEKEISTYFLPELSASNRDDRVNHGQTKTIPKLRPSRKNKSELTSTHSSLGRIVRIVEPPDSIGRRPSSMPQRSSSRLSWPNSTQSRIKASLAVPNGGRNADKISRKRPKISETVRSINSSDKNHREQDQARLGLAKDSTDILPGQYGGRRFREASWSARSAQHGGGEPPRGLDRGEEEEDFGQDSKQGKLQNIQASPVISSRTSSNQPWKIQRPISESHQYNHEQRDRQQKEKSDTDSVSMARLFWECNQAQTRAENAENLWLRQPVTLAAKDDVAFGVAGRPDLHIQAHPQEDPPAVFDQLPGYRWRDVGIYESQTIPTGVSGYKEFAQEPASEVPFSPDGAYNNAWYEADAYTYEHGEPDYGDEAYLPLDIVASDFQGPGNEYVQPAVDSPIFPSAETTGDRMAGFWRPHRLY